MGTEMKPEGYNAAYKRDKYLRHYTNPHRWGWRARWEATAARINVDDNILEIGCGSGQLANMLFDQQKRNYVGFDFSIEGIKVCQKLNLDPMVFYLGNAYDKINYTHYYDTIIACEVLEHLDDKKVLSLIKKGTKIVCSLPDFSAPNHLFHINDSQEIYERYKGIIDINYMSNKIDAWWVFEGVIL